MTMLYVKKAMFKHRKKSCEAAIGDAANLLI